MLDMLSDFVTLYTYKKSRRPADNLYPYGYGNVTTCCRNCLFTFKSFKSIVLVAGKYETIGSLAVSTLLIGGAIGIGWHSTELLLNVLQTPGVNESVSTAVATVVDSNTSPAVAETATHKVAAVTDHHGHSLNPNAAWFALISIVVKEWLYRASMLGFYFFLRCKETKNIKYD